MKIAIQWTRQHPQGWEWLDSSEWGRLPIKPVPDGNEILDDRPGWTCAVNVQGVIFQMDHIAVMDLPMTGGCRVYAWYDDPEDSAPDLHIGVVHEFGPVSPDPAHGRRYNTRQSVQRFGSYHPVPVFDAETGGIVTKRERIVPGVPSSVRPMDQFTVPGNLVVRHGVNMPDDLYKQHKALREPLGWREWSEGVPAQHLDSKGRVRGDVRA